MFQKVTDADFIRGEHAVLQFWTDNRIFDKLREQNRGKRKWSFLDGPITANNPMGVHHAWGRTYKDVYQRYYAMTGHELRYQNGFDCQGLWVEVEVEKQLQLGTKTAIEEFGIDRFVNECKRRVLRFAARQTEQSIRLGYWMDWDDPGELRKLAEAVGSNEPVTLRTPSGQAATGPAHLLVGRLGNPEWGGSYFTFSTENNETIWTFLKKCFTRGKVYRGYDVMPWSGRGGSAYSQMEVADGRRLTTHRSCFVRFPIKSKVKSQESRVKSEDPDSTQADNLSSALDSPPSTLHPSQEYLLVWTTTPWTLTSNVACAVNPDLEYVKLRTTRDGAVYYFAKDNLEYQRLGREFKEGFGRPEWSWPDGVPKLKTIGQIFKELGGSEVEGTLKGAEMVGWTYEGPFDDLPAQQQPGGEPVDERLLSLDSRLSAITCHRVIDGGRDSKGSPNVVAGEGTGIVHIAPGCGDIDHQLGREHHLVGIAPLAEDGTFGAGFGDFTGREAIDPETAELVFEKLREKHMLVAVETYPHVYPHCWRTGDELVFRLVDEWFINMDWRDEIKAVTEQINWIPDSIQGRERELEWLTNMSDWMISKKRFWGLALPIWVDESDPSDFEVIGSLAELKERAVEGWDDFAGNTPHRPWIDRVKIKSQKTGNVLTRIRDVGNPWLDAGIVPFSTMHYNSNRDEWQKWYPADFVTECFPGQFRNWFYSLLATATMVRYDETDDPAEKRPFKNLLGHRLVMNEDGQPMHKSDGTAIWFEEAAEQLGVDTMRWMYLAQNPAQDLRFGTRHPDEPIAIETPEGRIDKTKEGLPICRVTSKPSDEIRRQVLIPLWNSYAFFVNYAQLDEFNPTLAPVPIADRPEIDRWILSNLQALIEGMHRELRAYNVAAACGLAAEFIDGLSNWYIRRNRRRFWRSRKVESREGRVESQESRVKSEERGATQADDLSSGDAWEADKLAAYQTLYEVLVTLTKILAPMIPFLSERMFQNLVHGHSFPGKDNSDASAGGGSAPSDRELESKLRQAISGTSQSETAVSESVHLCAFPQPDPSLLDPELNDRMATAQLVVTLGHKLREEANLRVRQPLAELRYACAENARGLADPYAVIESLRDVITEELNVKQLTRSDNLDDLVHYSFKPNLKTLGPKYGKLLGKIRQQLPEVAAETLAPLRSGESVTLALDGDEITLLPDDVLISTEQAADWVCADEAGIQIALSTALTPELKREGMARDFVRHVQQARKDAGLEIQDRIRVFYQSNDAEVVRTVEEWNEYICAETLADAIERSDNSPADAKKVTVGESSILLWIEAV